MQTAKQEALNAIQQLPDNADMEEIIRCQYALENIRKQQQNAADGKTQPTEEPSFVDHLLAMPTKQDLFIRNAM